jgi:hypothetical protein
MCFVNGWVFRVSSWESKESSGSAPWRQGPDGLPAHKMRNPLRPPLPESVTELFVENFLVRVLPSLRVPKPSSDRNRLRAPTINQLVLSRQWEHLILTSYQQPTGLTARFSKRRIEPIAETNTRPVTVLLRNSCGGWEPSAGFRHY